MKIDFHEKFKHYSNIELLKIIKNPEHYQALAVEAAAKILEYRQISQFEIEQAESELEFELNQRNSGNARVELYKSRANDLFEPLVRVEEEMTTARWLYILLFVIALQYAWIFYNGVRVFWSYAKCDSCGFDILYVFAVIELLYTPVTFFLLLKKKHWGWILLFGEHVFGSIVRLGSFYLMAKGGHVLQAINYIVIPGLIINIGFSIFLWRKSVTDFFSINHKTKTQIGLIVILIAILFSMLMREMYRL